MTDVRVHLRAYFLKVIGKPINDDDDIFDLGLVDSLFALQLVTFIEEEFLIVTEPQDLDICNFCSIEALTCFIKRKHESNQ